MTLLVDHNVVLQCITDDLFWELCPGFGPFREQAEQAAVEALDKNSSRVLQDSYTLMSFYSMLSFWQLQEPDKVEEFVSYLRKRRNKPNEQILMPGEDNPRVRVVLSKDGSDASA